MDILSNSINEKIKEIETKIQKINYLQEYEKAKEFKVRLEEAKEKIEMLMKGETQTHRYYNQAMDVLEVIDFDIDDYLQNEGKVKEQELNRSVFLEKLKRFIDDTKGRNTETMLSDLKGMVQEIKDLELEENLFSEFYSLTAKALLSTFVRQAQKRRRD